MNQFHILNGDALKKQFPESISGEVFVVRECLIDGIVQGDNIEEFFQKRAEFISSRFEEYSTKLYYQKTVSEFEKIQNIAKEGDINLWFENDLFCQTNCWFVMYLLNRKTSNRSIHLVRPEEKNKYSFGAMTAAELLISFQNKISMDVSEIQQFSALWEAYQINDIKKMLIIAKTLGENYRHLIPVIKAHRDRVPKKDFPGRPAQALTRIMVELNTTEFGPIFQEFCRREGIYGLGDLQVKHIIDEIKNTAVKNSSYDASQQ